MAATQEIKKAEYVKVIGRISKISIHTPLARCDRRQ